MKVSVLIEKLKTANPNAVVHVIGDGYGTEAGTWIEGDPEPIGYLHPKDLANAESIILER